MKFKTHKLSLLNGANIASRAIGDNFRNIKISVTDKIELSATNTEMSIKTIVEGNIEEQGEICVDAKFFLTVLKTLPDNELEIEDKEQLNIRYNAKRNAISKVATFPTDNFPEYSYKLDTKPVILKEYILKELIDKTSFAASNNMGNRLMTGELLEIKNGNLRLAALDGHRVAIRDISSDGECKAIIPCNFLKEISRFLGTGEIEIYISDNMVTFKTPQTTFVSRLIEGTYFDIDKLLKGEYKTSVTVKKDALIDGLTRLIPYETDKKAAVFEFKDNSLNLSMVSVNGAAYDVIDTIQDGEDVRIGFNVSYIIDAVKMIDEEEVTLQLINAKSPAIIKGEGYFYMILPVNI